jgi:hypothetical protein
VSRALGRAPRVDASTLINLTNDEWLERWRNYRKIHPDYQMDAAGVPVIK